MTKYLIIGAGPCGLAMAKALKYAQIEYAQIEADTALGGNWFHGVYKTVYTDVCKDVMQYPDYPMPDSFPDFLSQSNMLRYLNQYAEEFDLKINIQFNTRAVWIQAIDDNLWKVRFHDGSHQTYKGVIICNGHHWDMNFPELPGNFMGEYIHSKEYIEPDQLKNKRVLVIGSGNSAADIACEAARVSTSSVMCFRDSPWIFPKTLMGIPLARIKLRKGPKFLDPLLVKLLIKLTFGKHSSYGLANPNHKPFDKHPTVSEELPYYLKHGRILIKKKITKIENQTVWFDDNTFFEFDVIVAATGFKLSFPFLPKSLIRTENKNLQCIGHCVYPDYKGLFFLGWQQVRGGIGTLASAFSKVIIDLIRIEEESDLPSGMVLRSTNNNSVSTTHLYGSKEIYSWIKKHNYKSMVKVSKKLKKKHFHCNIPTSDFKPPLISSLKIL
ncbi:MAG: NAD(P)-binding domain-containing protein [Ginsengibacter sp.]